MTAINGSAAAAREQARHSDGKFGEQNRPDPGGDIVTDPVRESELFRELAASGALEGDIRDAFDAAGVVDPTIVTDEQRTAIDKFLVLRAKLHASASRCLDAADRIRAARKEQAEHALRCAALDVVAWFPQVTELTLVDDQEGGWTWEASDTDGNDVSLIELELPDGSLLDMSELADSLYDYGRSIDNRLPHLVDPWCVGHRGDGEWAEGVELHRYTGHLVSARLDVAKLVPGG